MRSHEMPDFDSATLPAAIRSLFELNHYQVEGPVQIHGAEIDLVARSLSDPFGQPIYIEVTVEYVDNDKYGKDVGKLAMVGELEPGCQRLIVSSKGFSLPVTERAEKSRIRTLTYDDLFRRFERFDRYVTALSGESDSGQALASLNAIYEEPNFRDSLGEDPATGFLTRWRDNAAGGPGWIVVTGEYGTGKTALTRVLQYRWLHDYKRNPALPIVFRIELRDFARQFDANGLLHHFLDRNELGHVSLEFVRSLLHNGRIILLLDGYDEMAQYLHARERRACLEALAELSTSGARGVLTSRPNYFTEAEELQVFEVLYRSLSTASYRLTSATTELLERERRVDQLLAQFIERYERTLQDLSEPQTEALVMRVLADDPSGRAVVLGLLRRIFRSVATGDAVSLSGKPVIVSYLVEVVEGLKDAVSAGEADATQLNEWDVYKLVVDQLMLRDLERSPEINPLERREFLRRLALRLSQRGYPSASEELIKDLISKQFRQQLTRLAPEARVSQLERYFADLRSSATLTRDVGHAGEGWRFSHNSLREYLVAEHFVSRLEAGELVPEDVPISDAMRTFVASRGRGDMARHLTALAQLWKRSGPPHGKGAMLALLWDGITSLFPKAKDPRHECLVAITGHPISLANTSLTRLSLSTEESPTKLVGANFSDSSLYAVDFSGADLADADFSNAVLDAVRFCGTRLTGARFGKALLVDVDVSGAEVKGADFHEVSADSISLLLEGAKALSPRVTLEGQAALGYLRFHGAQTMDVPAIYIVCHDPHFTIVEKILEKLSEQMIRQRRGLAQRGVAHGDVTFARRFVQLLEDSDLIQIPKNRKDQVEVTDKGRTAFSRFVNERVLPPEVLQFLRK